MIALVDETGRKIQLNPKYIVALIARHYEGNETTEIWTTGGSFRVSQTTEQILGLIR